MALARGTLPVCFDIDRFQQHEIGSRDLGDPCRDAIARRLPDVRQTPFPALVDRRECERVEDTERRAGKGMIDDLGGR